MKMQQSTIDEACLLVTDGTHYTPPDLAKGVPFLTVKDFTHDGQIDLAGCAHISEDEFDKADKGNSAPKPGDVLFSKDGTVGKVYVVKTKDRFAVLSSLAILRPDASRLDARYFGWVLKTDSCLNQATRSKTGSAIRRIILKDLKRVNFPLPPLAEQKRIAAILDAANALRAKRRETLAQLDTLLQSTFLDMFGDPVTNPMGFSIKNLPEFYISRREGTKCGPFGSALKKDELVKTGVPVWNMDNIDPSGRMILPFRMWISEKKFRNLEPYKVLAGDIIISRAGTVGKMCVATEINTASIISTNLIRVRFGPDLLPIYFVSLMIYCKGRIGRLKTGPDGAFTHMSTGVLDKLKFPYPPLPLQRRFATIVKIIEKQKSRLRAHLAELDTLFAALQSRAFNGEL